MKDRDNAFKMMEDCLLPVFSEAVKMCQEISGREDYFSDPKNYRAGRRLYAMAFLSTAINRVNKDIVSAEHRKENIEELDLMEAGRYYQPNGLLSEKKENVCYNVLPQFCCLTNLGQYKSLRSIAKGKKSSQKINLNKI